MQESLEEITAAERESRAKIALEKAKEKTSRAATREKIKHQGLLAIENARMQFQREESERHRQHELLMLERQIELERVKARSSRHFIPDQIDPALH